MTEDQVEDIVPWNAICGMPYAGDVRANLLSVVENIKNNIKNLLEDTKKREEISIKMKKTVDAKGAYRVAKAIAELCSFESE
jgi:fibrillarin-like rRNA methylase